MANYNTLIADSASNKSTVVHGGGGVRRTGVPTSATKTVVDVPTPTVGGTQRVVEYNTLTQTPTESTVNTTSVSNPYNGYADQLASLYAQQQAQQNSYYQAQAQAAQNAYNQGLSALDSAYNSKLSNLDNSLNSTKQQLSSQYDYSKGNINSSAEDALRQAYINRMLSEKNLNQQLTAQGLSGGASESVRAGMLNNYGKSRNTIDDTRMKNIAGLDQTYNSNLADVLNNYYNQRSDADQQRMAYRMQLENALANNQIASLGDLQKSMAGLDGNYTSALQNALAKQASFNAKQASASNDSGNVTTGDSTVNLQNLASNVKARLASGESGQTIYNDLINMGMNDETISQVFASSGLYM